ncbi:DUF2911 domain-containing protein [Spirosoma luteum]|uniref:DUF2911 domain-containing protein n=1 Tax=Spirosoma luteum TaxID=431553 RepID=UPI0003828EFF|nr:DUF2911 domain-containing protein [Spirosoma luteum]
MKFTPMNRFFFVFLFMGLPFMALAQHENHRVKTDTAKVKPKSPRLTAMAMVGTNHVHIDYGSPSVRGRTIWNGLVTYNQVWATGAHKATWIEFGQDIIIQGEVIPKGKYGFFTIPADKEWTLIISKDWDMHLADDYNEQNDVVRLKTVPNKNATLSESLTYQVKETGNNKGRVSMSWENLTVSFDFKNK